MERLIEGFHLDEAGEWVAELSCLHGQHVRHRPPWSERPWVLDDEARAARVGTAMECPLCDRRELPEGLHLARTAGPWDEASLPAAIRRDHRVAARTWGRLRVTAGSATLRVGDDTVALDVGDEAPIPPAVPHAVALGPAGVVEVDFLVRSPGPSSD